MTHHSIPTPALQRWVTDLWLAAGSSSREAELTAAHLVGANLAGHDSHGVGMVPRYVDSWLADELQLNQHVEVVSDTGTILTLDGRRGMGQVVAYETMELAIERARLHGVAVTGLKHSHHLGRVGHWAEQANAAGMISVHFTNAVSKPVVAPHGGAQGRFLTNPFTVGIPMPGRAPILLDFATSAIALGKVRVAYNSGNKVPPGSLVDPSGVMTDDPSVLFPAADMPRGALLPFAGHKGHALAMVCELLGSALFGGDTTRPAHSMMKHAIWNNMLTIVFDPQKMHAGDLFNDEATAFIDWVKSAPLQQGTDAILMPGEPERLSRTARAHSIPVDGGTLVQMDQAADAVKGATGQSPGPLSALVVDA